GAAVLWCAVRPPPRPTLFPYTTLFRSLVVPLRDAPRSDRPDRERAAHLPPGPARHGPGGWGSMAGAPPRSGRHRGGGSDGGDDRSEEHTSNSSHVKISYAVFCLKKEIT